MTDDMTDVRSLATFCRPWLGTSAKVEGQYLMLPSVGTPEPFAMRVRGYVQPTEQCKPGLQARAHLLAQGEDMLAALIADGYVLIEAPGFDFSGNLSVTGQELATVLYVSLALVRR